VRSGFSIFAGGFFLAGQAFSQEAIHSPELASPDSAGWSRSNVAAVAVDRNLNTFNWTGRVLLDTTTMGTVVRMTEQYASSTILLDEGGSSSGQLRSDQENLALMAGRHLAKNLLSELLWSSVVYSDNKSVGLGHSAFHTVLGGMEILPAEGIVLTPLAGFRWDNRAGVKDKGLSYTLGADLDSVVIDGYQVEGKAQFHEDRLNPRLLQRHLGRVAVQKRFSEDARDSLEVNYGRNRTELYDVDEGNIESRAENTVSFANLLDYTLLPHLTTSLFVKITDRTLDRDIRHYNSLPDSLPRFGSSLDEFHLETYYQVSFRGEDGILAWARLGHDERNEQHAAGYAPNTAPNPGTFNIQNAAEKSKDNLTRHTSLTGMLSFPLSSSDTLSVSGAASIFRYDTPADLGEEARVDRDEQLFALSVSTRHHVSRSLDLGVTLDGNLNHIVYLFSYWSGNNNYNRVLRLSPSTTYRPTNAISSTNAFEVLANYTVYDYEAVADKQSYSYREFGWVDSSSAELTRRVGLDLYCQVKLYETGQLRWSDFSESTENSFVDRTISTQVRFSPEEDLLFAVGIRSFSQLRYKYPVGVKTLDSYLRSFGPTCLIRWDVGMRSRIMIKGWYERRTFSGGPSTELTQNLPNLTMNIAITL